MSDPRSSWLDPQTGTFIGSILAGFVFVIMLIPRAIGILMRFDKKPNGNGNLEARLKGIEDDVARAHTRIDKLFELERNR